MSETTDTTGISGVYSAGLANSDVNPFVDFDVEMSDSEFLEGTPLSRSYSFDDADLGGTVNVGRRRRRYGRGSGFGGAFPRPTLRTSNINTQIANFSRMPREQVMAWQQRLWGAGLYPSEVYRNNINVVTGFADADTTKAYGTLLRAGIREQPRGTTLDEILARMTAQASPLIAGLAGGGGGEGRRKSYQEIEVSSSASIEQAVHATAKELMGKRADPELVAKIIKRIQGKQAAKGKRSISRDVAAANTKTGDAVAVDVGIEEAVSPEAEVEAAIREEQAPAVGAHSMAKAFNKMLQIIGSGE